MSALWAVIPAKPFAVGKSRLMLPPETRAATNRAFLTHVLRMVALVLPPAHIVVVSRDEAAMAVARQAGAHGLPERNQGNLNDALTFGARFAADHDAGGVLSLFSDLPHLLAEDVEAMLDAFTGGNVVIAPDEAGTGTNALLMAPGALPYRHGRGSLWRHLEAAREADTPFSIVRRHGLMRDVDTPDDFAAMTALSAPN